MIPGQVERQPGVQLSLRERALPGPDLHEGRVEGGYLRDQSAKILFGGFLGGGRCPAGQRAPHGQSFSMELRLAEHRRREQPDTDEQRR